MRRVTDHESIATITRIVNRVPRHWIEVAMVPVVVTLIGIAWIQAGAWRVSTAKAEGLGAPSIAYPLGAVVILFLVFQFLLRPGIHFY
jgi:hypothetical protein